MGRRDRLHSLRSGLRRAAFGVVAAVAAGGCAPEDTGRTPPDGGPAVGGNDIVIGAPPDSGPPPDAGD